MILRCPCGLLASSKRPCKRCGRSLHLAHGHPPPEDPDHFERIKHEWFYTGGTHVVEGAIHQWLAERCEYVHEHPEPFEHEHGHEHQKG